MKLDLLLWMDKIKTKINNSWYKGNWSHNFPVLLLIFNIFCLSFTKIYCIVEHFSFLNLIMPTSHNKKKKFMLVCLMKQFIQLVKIFTTATNKNDQDVGTAPPTWRHREDWAPLAPRSYRRRTGVWSSAPWSCTGAWRSCAQSTRKWSPGCITATPSATKYNHWHLGFFVNYWVASNYIFLPFPRCIDSRVQQG